MANDDVRFVEETHTYYINGVIYPSVSEILAPFCDFSRVPRDVLERKRQIGRATHKCIELDEAGTLDPDTVDPQVMPYFESWRLFKATKPLQVCDAERIVYSKKHRYAGRFDLTVNFYDDPEPWLLDVKCVDRMMPETALQTAAYAYAYGESAGIAVTKRAGLQLKPDGSQAEYFPYDRIGNKNDFPLFLNAVNLNRWKRNHT